jgi:outer membrane protein OmpA-like peptidoglycan-associated protein
MKTKNYLRFLMGSALAVLTCLILTSGRLYAQSSEVEHERDAAEDHEMDYPHKLTLVLGGGVNYNMANGPYILDHNLYDVGHWYMPEFHLGLEIPIATKVMFAPRLNYEGIGAEFTDGAATSPTATQIPEFAYDARTIGLDLLFKFAINRFHFLVGPYASYLIKKTWAHGAFADADASKVELPGTHRVFFSAGAGVGYDIPLNSASTVWLTPEATYNYPITNLGAGDNSAVDDAGPKKIGHLKPSTLRGALSLKFDISPTPPPPAPAPQARPLSVNVTAKGVGPNGEEVSEPQLPEKGVTSRNTVTLLPYVFFDDNSATIPARYSQSGSTGFSETQLQNKDALDVNHALLDIVGSRMKQYPELSVKVTGTNSNTGSERHNTSLSKERAMAVKNYLVNTWGISGDRVSIEARNLPEIPTNPVTPAGIEENRRAEIIDSKTSDPVQFSDRSASFNGETLIRYETTVVNPDNIPISNWRITLDDNGTQIGSAESGSGTPPSVIPSKIPNADRYVGKSVHYKLDVTDVNGKTYSADGMTRVVKNTSDESYLEKYAMLSFDFDRSLVNDRAEKMMKVISESINRDALGVNINGYCDITGTDEYNQALSERRANSAASILQTMAKMPANVSVAGHGRANPKFSNDLPEGRQLNRRVEVEIQKSK